MYRKPPETLIQKRTAYRRHAKRRFEERFDLSVNRDDLRELEQKIRGRRAVATGLGQPGRSQWLVEAAGKLIPVIYDHAAQRIVTALPEDALDNIPPEILRAARVRLLPDVHRQIIDDINSGRAQLAWARDADTSFHHVEYDGELFHVGYRRSTGSLIPYRKKPKGHRTSSECAGNSMPSHDDLFGRLELSADVAESFRQQIRANQSRALWRYSNSLVFHEVLHGSERVRLGYNPHRDRFYHYQHPPETMPELRSSVRLFQASEEVIHAVTDIVRRGEATLVEVRDENNSVYTVEFNGETHHVMYSRVRDRIEIYVPKKRSAATAVQSTPANSVAVT